MKIKNCESIQILQKDTTTNLSTSFKAFDENILLDDDDQQQQQHQQEEQMGKRRESMMNLLEINRFLREQKDHLKKKYQNISLEHEITAQRLQK